MIGTFFKTPALLDGHANLNGKLTNEIGRLRVLSLKNLY